MHIEATVTIDLSGLRVFEKNLNDQLTHKAVGPVSKAFKQWGARYRGFLRERFDKYSKGGGDWPPLAESTMRARRGPSGKSKVDARAKAGKIRKRISKLNKQLHKINSSPAKRGKTIKTANKRKRIIASIAKAKAGFKKNKSLANRKFAILRDTGTLFAALSPTFDGKPGQLEQGIPFGIRVGYGGNQSHPTSKGAATIADIASYHQTGGGHLPVRRIIVEPEQKVIDQMAKDMQRALDSMLD